jgi:SAM-dependent methyltransferase
MATASIQEQPAPAEPSPAELEALLANLYRRQRAKSSDNHGYLAEHARPACIANQVRTFRLYRPYLPERGMVLDWGCCHAPDSCLLRACHGDRLDLYGCDFAPPRTFRVFHRFAQLKYAALADNVSLPFVSGMFDAVIGSGVLEHTAMDRESLKELYRVLRPDGTLVVTYLPNRLSVHEWVRRVVRRRDFHRRLYGLAEARKMLLSAGFYPLEAGYQTFVWKRGLEKIGLGRWGVPLGRALSCLAPVHLFCGTLYLIARKMLSM